MISTFIEIEEGVEDRREGLTKTKTPAQKNIRLLAKCFRDRFREGVVAQFAHPRSTVRWFQR